MTFFASIPVRKVRFSEWDVAILRHGEEQSWTCQGRKGLISYKNHRRSSWTTLVVEVLLAAGGSGRCSNIDSPDDVGA